ncbi:hypothetical protein ACHQM5_030629 [Ranunculus cassubicifolius]
MIPSKKRPSIGLSLFINNLSESSSKSSSKSPRNFEFDNGVVGLGIVAAMNEIKTRRISSRSQPIPIVFTKPNSIKDPILEKNADDEELSESYTCVISHLGKKRVYFDGGIAKSGVFFTSPITATSVFQNGDFLSSCYLCRKKLHGLDIFMYRGDKSFCSAECRCQQILSDERKAKCGSGALKSFAYSVSPCSAPTFFSAGVAAA